MERLNPADVLAISKTQKGSIIPCGTCNQEPATCETDGERALSYDPVEQAAQCLKYRQIIRLDGDLGASNDIIIETEER